MADFPCGRLFKARLHVGLVEACPDGFVNVEA
jgi:hypothetical protein